MVKIIKSSRTYISAVFLLILKCLCIFVTCSNDVWSKFQHINWQKPNIRPGNTAQEVGGKPSSQRALKEQEYVRKYFNIVQEHDGGLYSSSSSFPNSDITMRHYSGRPSNFTRKDSDHSTKRFRRRALPEEEEIINAIISNDSSSVEDDDTEEKEEGPGGKI